MKYFYKTEFGTFFIIPDIDNGVGLWIKDTDDSEGKLGWYSTAHQAADDVHRCETGFDEWDEQEEVAEPSDLDEWTKSL